MKNTTLCYLEDAQTDYLLLHRTKKENDRESRQVDRRWREMSRTAKAPRTASAARSSLEETGPDPHALPLSRHCDLCLRPLSDGEYMHLFTANRLGQARYTVCDEGVPGMAAQGRAGGAAPVGGGQDSFWTLSAVRTHRFSP